MRMRTANLAMPVAPAVKPDTDTSADTDLTWKVVVWNDPVNLFDYVIWVLMELFGHSKAKAEKLTSQIHHEGRAIVNDGPREQAEMDCYRLHRQGLWATLEK
jgi:ATP-dependent Clp protease adaptor protein ClpS